jgi:hypothetical protein
MGWRAAAATAAAASVGNSWVKGVLWMDLTEYNKGGLRDLCIWHLV